MQVQLGAVIWWLIVTFLLGGVVSSLTASYIQPHIENIRAKFSDSRRIKNERDRLYIEMMVEQLSTDPTFTMLLSSYVNRENTLMAIHYLLFFGTALGATGGVAFNQPTFRLGLGSSEVYVYIWLGFAAVILIYAAVMVEFIQMATTKDRRALNQYRRNILNKKIDVMRVEIDELEKEKQHLQAELDEKLASLDE